MTNEMIQQLRKVQERALSALSEMKWQNIHFERYEDYERGYASGHEQVMEEYEDLVDDIAKILKQHDIEAVQNTKHIPSDKQMMLNL